MLFRFAPRRASSPAATIFGILLPPVVFFHRLAPRIRARIGGLMKRPSIKGNGPKNRHGNKGRTGRGAKLMTGRGRGLRSINESSYNLRRSGCLLFVSRRICGIFRRGISLSARPSAACPHIYWRAHAQPCFASNGVPDNHYSRK